MYKQSNMKLYAQYVNLIICLIFGLLLSLVGTTIRPAYGEDLTIVYLPRITRYGPYVESTGILDPSFGDGGRVITDLNGTNDSGVAIALQRDGKLLVGGEIDGAYGRDVAVARYNSDGSLDTSFSDDGWVSTDLSGDEEAAAIAIQQDGKILLAGTTLGDFVLVRYNSDGSLDDTFGLNGWVRTDILGIDDNASAVAIQSDGRIVVAGFGMNGSFYDFALVRYLENGDLDTSFGVDGKVTTDLTTQHDQARGIAIQPDGKIVVVGTAKHIGYFHDFAVARYNSDGSLDTTFGTTGWVFTDFNLDHDFANAVLLQPDGRIVVAGAATIDDLYHFALARYTTVGLLDPSFDGDGRVTTNYGSGHDDGYAIIMQPDGKLIVASYANNGTNDDYAVVRYNPNGSLDTGFAEDGMVLTDLSGFDDKGLGVVLQQNGRIVVAGSAFNGVDMDFALVRYK